MSYTSLKLIQRFNTLLVVIFILSWYFKIFIFMKSLVSEMGDRNIYLIISWSFHFYGTGSFLRFI